MKITLNNPIVIGEKVYPFALLSLSISTEYGKTDNYSVACRLLPCREVDGEIERLEDRSINLSAISALEDSDLREGVEAIVSAVQLLVNKKGV